MGSPPVKLPRKSFAAEPVHLQLAALCRRAILKGDYQPGERFPSERELANRFKVSRATANKVISTLIAEELLELQKGIGTRVKKRRTLFASLSGMESFTAHAREQGLSPSTEVLKFQHVDSADLPGKVRSGLGFENQESQPVVYLERLRLADGIPMILEHRWVREDLAPGLSREDVAESFYRILEEKFGLPMTGEQHSISAVILNQKLARRFRIRKPTAALLVQGSGFVNGRQPLWYQRLYYRGDRYQLHHETGSAAAPAMELRLQEN